MQLTPDWQIQACIQQAISGKVAAQPVRNSLYVVFVEPGVAVRDPSGATSLPGGGFLGYHSYFYGHDIYGHSGYISYAVIPFPGGVNGSPQMYGYPSAAAEMTDVASHEIAESITDPYLNAWYDNQRGEIGDITESYHQYFAGYYVQLVANKADQAMLVSNGPVYYDTAHGMVTYNADAQHPQALVDAVFIPNSVKSVSHTVLDEVFARNDLVNPPI